MQCRRGSKGRPLLSSAQERAIQLSKRQVHTSRRPHCTPTLTSPCRYPEAVSSSWSECVGVSGKRCSRDWRRRREEGWPWDVDWSREEVWPYDGVFGAGCASVSSDEWRCEDVSVCCVEGEGWRRRYLMKGVIIFSMYWKLQSTEGKRKRRYNNKK